MLPYLDFSIDAEYPISDPHTYVAITLPTINSLGLPMSASENLQKPQRTICITVNPCWVEAVTVVLFVLAETAH